MNRDAPHGVAPELDGRCVNLHESVGWWTDVHNWRLGPALIAGQPDRTFGAERCNIALSLNIDGVQPFDRGGVSILPFVCMVLNLPENLRHRWQHLLFAGIVPGPKAPKNLNTYLHVLVDELVDLWRVGFNFKDPFNGQTQTARVKLLFTCMDYPAHADVNCQTKQGSTYGCQKCDVRGATQFGRQAYGNYADLLPGGRPPQLLTHAEYLARVALISEIQNQRGKSQAFKDNRLREECKQVAGRSALCRLTYFDMVEHTLLDMMHLVQGVVGAHMVPLLKGNRLGPMVPIVEALEAEAEAQAEAAGAGAAQPAAAAAAAPAAKRRRKGSTAAAAAAALPSLARWQPAFPAMADSQTALVERAYVSIRAPLHIAPASKMPFQRSGEMTAHHWLNFAKCHGIVLLRAYLTRAERELKKDVERDTRTLLTMRWMLELIRLLLQSDVTAKVKLDTASKVRSLAAFFETDWPPTEHAIVMHLLVFHMPATIRKWGPARSYWCFPFERMIGKLSSSIKNRRTPEINLVNRYLLNLATHQSDAAADAGAAAADEEYQESHPLVIRAQATNSQLQGGRVFWPAATKNNRRRHAQFDAVSHARSRVLEPMLGRIECELYRGVSTAFTLWNYRISVQVGRWRYNTADREDRGRQVGKSRTSWFRIRAKNVPNWDAAAYDAHLKRVEEKFQMDVDAGKRTKRSRYAAAEDTEPLLSFPEERWAEEWDPEAFIYGRIINFTLLEMLDAKWAKTYQLARVRLYCSRRVDKPTQLPLIALDLDQIFHITREDKKVEETEYIQVQHLDSLIGIAPIAEPSGEQWLVLPIDPC